MQKINYLNPFKHFNRTQTTISQLEGHVLELFCEYVVFENTLLPETNNYFNAASKFFQNSQYFEAYKQRSQENGISYKEAVLLFCISETKKHVKNINK